jgi:SNF2 family DNA or RNA helicase
VNLFIADDVGLGKTIEAGLIVGELLMRKKVREIVVACPPSMLLQWQEELEQRFGRHFEILDKDFIVKDPPRTGLRSQSLDGPFPFPDFPPSFDRRSLCRASSQRARDIPCGHHVNP